MQLVSHSVPLLLVHDVLDGPPVVHHGLVQAVDDCSRHSRGKALSHGRSGGARKRFDPSVSFLFCPGVKRGRPRKNVQDSKSNTESRCAEHSDRFCTRPDRRFGRRTGRSHLRVYNATTRIKQIGQKAFDLMGLIRLALSFAPFVLIPEPSLRDLAFQSLQHSAVVMNVSK